MAKRDPQLDRYLKQVSRFPRLSSEEERRLIGRVREHEDRRAAEILVCSNLRHVLPIAARYLGAGEPIADLVAEGNLGVLHAVRKFDPDKGSRLATYARLWIRAYLTRYTRRCRSLVSSPLHDDAVLMQKIRSERARLRGLGLDADELEVRLADAVDLSRLRVAQIEQRFGGRDVSMDVPVRDGEVALSERLASSHADPFARLLCVELDGLLRAAMAKASLADNERYVVEQRLLRPPGAEESLAEVGRRLAISREWARRLELRANAKIAEQLGALAC